MTTSAVLKATVVLALYAGGNCRAVGVAVVALRVVVLAQLVWCCEWK